jgi:hypothetical protein
MLASMLRRVAAPDDDPARIRAEIVDGTRSEQAFWRSAAWFCATVILSAAALGSLVIGDLTGVTWLEDVSGWPLYGLPVTVVLTGVYGGAYWWHRRREAKVPGRCGE